MNQNKKDALLRIVTYLAIIIITITLWYQIITYLFLTEK